MIDIQTILDLITTITGTTITGDMITAGDTIIGILN